MQGGRLPGQDGGVGEGGVELGEVEHDVYEGERDAEHKDAEDEVEGQEPLAALPQEVHLLWGPLCVRHLAGEGGEGGKSTETSPFRKKYRLIGEDEGS